MSAEAVTRWQEIDQAASDHLDTCTECRPSQWCAELEAMNDEARTLWANMTEAERDEC